MKHARNSGALALLLFAGTAEAAMTHSLLPWKAQAGRAFDLMLAGDYACNMAFSHESTYVKADRIVLAFLAEEIPNIRCAPMPQPKGPEFKLPALAAGDYPIYSQSLAPCMVGPVVCGMHVEPVLVGTLKVTADPAFAGGWFLHPKRVESGKDVRLGLLNPDRASCENAFNPARDTVRFGVAELSFSTLYSLAPCPISVRPFGPLFHLGDLAPGSYRVEGYDLPACSFQNPPCIPIIPPVPVLVDTLVVGGPTALGPLPERPAAPAPAWRRLPGGLGLVRPESGGTGPGLKVERIVMPDGRQVRP